MACIRISFLLMTEQYSMSCFCLLAIVNNAAVNIRVQISVQVSAFNSFGYISRRQISGSCHNTVYSFLRNLEFAF